MNTKKALSIFAAVVFFCVFNANGQINLLSNDITFRTPDNADQFTTHYGSLSVDGGNCGSGCGWLSCNNFWCGYFCYIGGYFYAYDKHFIQPHPSDISKVIVYTTIESGEALTVARGMSVTKGGKSEVILPDHFSLVTSVDIPVTVHLTPEKSPALLYITQKSKEKITVAIKAADYSEFGDVEFSYQVIGVRDGFENGKVIRDISNINDTTNISPKQKAMKEKVQAIMAKEKEKMGKR